MNVIAIDIGTTHCKAVIINEKGKVLKTFQSANKTIEPQPGWNEQDPDEIFNSVAAVIATNPLHFAKATILYAFLLVLPCIVSLR
jgi:glycerol kinase